MSIRGHIALVIGTCSAAALALAVWVGALLVDRVAKRGEHGALWMAVKDSERILEATGTFLVTADLVMASGETHLLDGALDQAERIHGIAAELSISEQRQVVADGIAQLKAVVVSLTDRMESVATTEETVPFDVLEAHDADAARLVSLTQGFYDEMNRRGMAADRQLVAEDGRVQNLVLAALVAYLATALLVWHRASRRLATPIDRLRKGVASGNERYEELNLANAPQEIRELGLAIRALSSREVRAPAQEPDRASKPADPRELQPH